MTDDLADIDDLEEEEEKPESSLTEKQRAEASQEARRKLESRLEEVRLRKQIGDYDYDLD